MTEEAERNDSIRLDPFLKNQLRNLKIWPNLVKRFRKDPHFTDAISTSYRAVMEIVDYRKDADLTIGYRREPYMWALLYIVDCDCNHKESLELWKELSENLMRHLEPQTKRLSDYLRLIRLEVRSAEDKEWEDDTL